MIVKRPPNPPGTPRWVIEDHIQIKLDADGIPQEAHR